MLVLFLSFVFAIAVSDDEEQPQPPIVRCAKASSPATFCELFGSSLPSPW